MKLKTMLLLGVALAFGSAVSGQEADEEALDPDAEAIRNEMFLDVEPERCLRLSRIRRTEIIDDSTIVFHVGRDIYVNQLPRTCPGLKRNDRFMYEVNMAQLCSTDWITVLERTGFGNQRGFSCGLGEFFPITEADLALLKAAEEEGVGRRGRAAEPTPIELPEPEEEESDGADE